MLKNKTYTIIGGMAYILFILTNKNNKIDFTHGKYKLHFSNENSTHLFNILAKQR